MDAQQLGWGTDYGERLVMGFWATVMQYDPDLIDRVGGERAVIAIGLHPDNGRQELRCYLALPEFEDFIKEALAVRRAIRRREAKREKEAL